MHCLEGASFCCLPLLPDAAESTGPVHALITQPDDSGIHNRAADRGIAGGVNPPNFYIHGGRFLPSPQGVVMDQVKFVCPAGWNFDMLHPV